MDAAAEIRLLRQRVAAMRRLITDSLDGIDQELVRLQGDEPPSHQNRQDWTGYLSGRRRRSA